MARLTEADGDTAAMILNCGEGSLGKIAEYLSAAAGRPMTVQEVIEAIIESTRRERKMGWL